MGDTPEIPWWNRCFLCPSDITEEECAGKAITKVSSKLILKYLLQDQNLTTPVSQSVMDLVSNSDSVTQQITGTGPPSVLKICSACDHRVELLMTLHQQYESIQMRILDLVQSLRKTVIFSSLLPRPGENMKVKREFERVGNKLEELELVEEGDVGGTRCKFLEGLSQFQTYVSENGVDQLYSEIRTGIPFVKLERVVVPPPTKRKRRAKTNMHLIQSEDVKMESEILDEGPRTDSGDDWCNDDELGTSDSDMPNSKKVKASSSGTKVIIKRTRRKIKQLFKPKKIQRRNRSQPKPKASAVPKSRGVNLHTRWWHCESENCEFKTIKWPKMEEHLRTHETLEKNFGCSECNLQFTQSQYLELHNAVMHTDSKQYCDICGVKVPRIDVENHLKEHKEKYFSCKWCSYHSGTFMSLVTHSEHHAGAEIKCELCPETDFITYPVKKPLLQHLYECHGYEELLLKCKEPGCAETFFDTYSRSTHETTHGRYSCSLCDLSFESGIKLKSHNKYRHEQSTCKLCPSESQNVYNSLNELKRHQKRDHRQDIPPETFTCSICAKQLSTKCGLIDHEATHSGSNDFKCDICNKFATNSRQKLKYHRRTVHRIGKKHSCEHCTEKFMTTVGLKSHLKTHTGEFSKPLNPEYQCEHCGKSFRKNHQLKQHVERHHGGEDGSVVPSTWGKPKQCTLCDKTFKEKLQLMSHCISEHNFPKHKCDVCSKQFMNQYLLAAHQRLRHEIGGSAELFTCDQCGKQFRDKSKLRDHKTTHGDIKNFTCETCSFSTKTKRLLKQHQWYMHADLLELRKCPYCIKKFVREEALSTHIATYHEEGKPHYCEQCGKEFNQVVTYRNHMKKHHGITPKY